MKYIYKLTSSKEDADITIGHFTSRNKAIFRAEDIIKRSGESVLVKRKRANQFAVIGNEGAYFLIETIWVE